MSTVAPEPLKAPEPLEEFQSAFETLMAAFDPTILASEVRGKALALFAQVEKTMAVAGAITASMMANEHSDPFEHVPPIKLAQMTSRCSGLWGVTSPHAYRVIETGWRLVEQPQVRAAALAGTISLTQAHLVTEAVRSDPTAIDFLLKTARFRNVAGLAIQCRRVRQGRPLGEPRALAPAEDTEREAVRATDDVAPPSAGTMGHLRTWFDSEDVWHLEAVGTRQDGERFIAALNRFFPLDAQRNDRHSRSYDTDNPKDGPLVALMVLAEAVELAGLGNEDWADGLLTTAPAGPRPRKRTRPRYRLPEPEPFRPREFPLDCLDWLHADNDDTPACAEEPWLGDDNVPEDEIEAPVHLRLRAGHPRWDALS